MKRIYSTTIILAMMVAALSFTACGDDNDDGEGASKGKKSLVVDGESYYAANCTAEQTRSSGMYLTVYAVTDPDFPISGKELVVHISPCKVADLNEGDVFDDHNMTIRTWRGLTQISVNSYDWDILEGDITIKKISSMEMTIKINNLVMQHEISGVKHSISGTAVLDSGVYDSQGNLLSFKDAIH